jgi:hypothetical protein
MPLTAKEFIEKKKQEFENDKKLQKKILIEDNEGEFCCVTRDRWIFIGKSDVPGHVLCLERLKICKDGVGKCRTKLEEGGYVYRPGFFVIGKKFKPTTKITHIEDNLVWEGHAPLVPQEDFKQIVKNAFKEGLINPQFLFPSRS